MCEFKMHSPKCHCPQMASHLGKFPLLYGQKKGSRILQWFNVPQENPAWLLQYISCCTHQRSLPIEFFFVELRWSYNQEIWWMFSPLWVYWRVTTFILSSRERSHNSLPFTDGSFLPSNWWNSSAKNLPSPPAHGPFLISPSYRWG